MTVAAMPLTWETKESTRKVRHNYKCQFCKTARSTLVETLTRRTYRSDRISAPVSTSRKYFVGGVEVREHSWWPECCGRFMKGGEVKGSYDAAKKCDDRCTGATGHKCECSCGGMNHGADHDLT